MGGLELALLVAATIADWDGVNWLFYSGLALLVIAFFWARASLIGVGLTRTLDADRVFAGDQEFHLAALRRQRGQVVFHHLDIRRGGQVTEACHALA